MSSLQNHKRRIKAVSNTLEVTNAMELVSMAKLQKLKSVYNSAKDYYELKTKAMSKVLKNLEIKVDEAKDELLIVVTSSLGLCGNYNEEVLETLKKLDLKNKKLIVLGEKGINYCKENEIEILKEYPEYNETISDELFNYVLDLKNKNLIKSIEVLYTSYKNNFIHPIKYVTIYPFKLEQEEKEEYLIETELDLIINMYLKDCLESLIFEAILSENASRNVAMHQASDNARDLKDKLTLIYNKLRQQQITNEIRDIIGGE